MNYYYKFWLLSSGQSDKLNVRVYQKQPTKLDLEDDCKKWASSFDCWHIAEHISYGWERIKSKDLPKNRADALKRWDKICKTYTSINNKKRLLRELLGNKPYNGEKS